MAGRFIFVFAFQFSMSVLKRFIAYVIPDIPKDLALKKKREDHIASTIFEPEDSSPAKHGRAKTYIQEIQMLAHTETAYSIFLIRNVCFCGTYSTCVVCQKQFNVIRNASYLIQRCFRLVGRCTLKLGALNVLFVTNGSPSFLYS